MWGNDSQRLLLEYFDVIQDSPFQIYHSILLFSPSSSWLHNYYSTELSQVVKVVKGLSVCWRSCFRTVELYDNPLALACWKDTIVVGLEESQDIMILDRISGCQAAILSGHTNGVRCGTFSSDGLLFISGSDDGTVKLWDIQTGGVIKNFYNHTSSVFSVSISVDCSMIVSGSYKAIYLWNIEAEECCYVIEEQGWVVCVGFSPTDPQHFISVSDSGVKQWDVSGHQIKSTHEGSYFAFSSDGSQFALCQETAVLIKNSGSGEIMAEFYIAKSYKKCCCFSPDNRLIAVAADNTIYVWDLTGSNPCIVETFTGHSEIITSLIFSSPSSLISSSYDGSIKFWQIGTSPIDPVITDPDLIPLTSVPIKSVTLQAEYGIAISSDLDGVVRTWDISTGLCKASFQVTKVGGCDVRDVRLINGKLIFVWVSNEYICIWDLERGGIIDVVDSFVDLADFMDKIEDIRISGDGSKIFCLYQGSIQAYSIWTGVMLAKVELESHIDKRFLTVDGPRVWVHSSKLEFQGWNFDVPSSPVQLSDISPPHLNGTKLWDHFLSRLIDVSTGKVVFQLAGEFECPAVSQWDSQYLIAGYESGEVLILNFSHMFS